MLSSLDSSTQLNLDSFFSIKPSNCFNNKEPPSPTPSGPSTSSRKGSTSGSILSLRQHQNSISSQGSSDGMSSSMEPTKSQSSTTVPVSVGLVSAANGTTDVICCNGCKLGLEETSDSVVVSFGSSLWHVECRCAKCSNLVEHDTNLLLLSDGSPVCENCSYICSVCQNPISNEAIVTGDESYHADCFRCRSCSNKIEELIFAKTSQGIWCMACHNERVARSRKHAEAKRSRTARKEKEARSGRREREKSNLSATNGASESGSFDMADLNAIPTAASLDFDSRPIPPPHSPVPTASSSMSAIDNSSVSPHTVPSFLPPNGRPRTSPQDGRHSSDDTFSTNEHTHHTHSDSKQSISSLAKGTAALSINVPNYRNIQETGRASSDPLEIGSGWESRSNNTISDSREPPRRRSLSRPPLPSSDSHPPPPRSVSATSPLSPSFSPRNSASSAPYDRTSSRQGSLSAPAPTDKSSNRRSGFYGAMARAAAAEAAALTDAEQTATSLGRQSQELDSEVVPLPPSPLSPSPPETPSKPPLLPELHKSMSFYDPDTLLFLDHVGSEGSQSPKALSLSRRSQSYKKGVSNMGSDQIEHLTPDLNESSGEEEGRRVSRTSEKSDISRKVRESIRRSRGEETENENGMGMDVDLVEMLLSELDGTKNEMQDLQSKYNAFRRASRSAFEGFSMAREEYDKEVFARRDTEARMDVLKIRFTEQALKLAAVDKEQEVTEALNRKSKDLRISVVGMEKQLSQLKAEVELSTAQVEELGAIDLEEAQQSSHERSGSINHLEIARSLNTRLESVKDQHRRDIETLIRQRDDLNREMAELRTTRNGYTEEITSLNRQSSLLLEQNAEATRQLDATRDSINKLRAPSPPERAHQYSPSVSSFVASSSNLHLPRSPLASSSRNGAPSPTMADSEAELIQRDIKLEEQPAVVKKFKWGKAKVDTTRTGGVSTSSSTAARIAAAAPIRSFGSTDLSSRSHIFQQTSILRPVKCDYCGDKLWGLNEVRCTICGCYTHTKCSSYLTTACNAHAPSADEWAGNANGHVMFGSDLTVQATIEGRQVPVVVSKCIAAVEAYGMNYEGVYRKSGGTGQTKLITQCFERGQEFDLQDLDKFNDLAAVTSCMKNFFRSLPDPLFTHALHENFVSCTELSDGEVKLAGVEKVLFDLPEVHFYTARMLIGHLHRIHLQSGDNKMTPANLGVVFGPTVLRSKDPSREFSDMGSKAKLVELLVENYPRLFSKSYSQ